MPHYYSHKETNDFGKIIVIPKGIRYFRIFGYSIFPYVTMSKIRFTLRVEKLPQHDGINKHLENVYIQLGDGSFSTIKTILDKKTDIEGIAMYTGDTKFFVAPANYSTKDAERFISKDGILLFEDNVISINNYVWGGCSLALLIITVLSILISWLLGIIQINPHWIATW